MVELIKNIGLGIFINGAYALQFVKADFSAVLAVVEGLALLSFAIYKQRGEQ